MSPEDVEAEYWAHFYAEREGSGEEYEDDDLDLDDVLARLEDGGDDDWEELISDRS